MRSFGVIMGYLMWIGAGLIMFIFWLMALTKWLGVIGMILGLILSPGLIIFPMVYWIVEGVFPVLYFIVWGIGIAGLIIAGISRGDK